LSPYTAPGRDVFLVLVDALPGRDAEYGSWFAGSHMKDMRRLSGVASAQSYRIATLDDRPAPASFCAIYEMDNARAVLSEIARLKGSAALPTSPLQGAMTWRIFERILPPETNQLTAGATLLLTILAAPRENGPPIEEIRGLDQVLADHGVKLIWYLRLSELQPRRGSDWGWAILAHSPTAKDEFSEIKRMLARLSVNLPTRYLKLTPISEGDSSSLGPQ
jgi:hypothetical protein